MGQGNWATRWGSTTQLFSVSAPLAQGAPKAAPLLYLSITCKSKPSKESRICVRDTVGRGTPSIFHLIPGRTLLLSPDSGTKSLGEASAAVAHSSAFHHKQPHEKKKKKVQTDEAENKSWAGSCFVFCWDGWKRLWTGEEADGIGTPKKSVQWILWGFYAVSKMPTSTLNGVL